MTNNKKICGCVTCNQAKMMAIEIASGLAEGKDMCPIAIFNIGVLLQAFAQEQISQQVLFVHFERYGALSGMALEVAGPHYSSVMENVTSESQAMLHDLVTDADMVKAAFAGQRKHKPANFPIDEYIAGITQARSDNENRPDPRTELLSAILNSASKRH